MIDRHIKYKDGRFYAECPYGIAYGEDLGRLKMAAAGLSVPNEIIHFIEDFKKPERKKRKK